MTVLLWEGEYTLRKDNFLENSKLATPPRIFEIRSIVSVSYGTESVKYTVGI